MLVNGETSLEPATPTNDVRNATNDDGNLLLGHLNDDQDVVALGPEQLLGPSERRIVARLLRVPKRARAMHAYIIGLLIDPDTQAGQDLRRHAIAALAASVLDPDIATHWTLVPESIRTWLQTTDTPPSEIGSVVILADLLTQEHLEPRITQYLDAVKLSFESIAGFDAPEARDRLFSPADRLDAKFLAAFGAFGEFVPNDNRR